MGISLVQHPLESNPASYTEAINAVMDANISDAKKLEWSLDLLREYDEKEMERYEAFLISRRHQNLETQLQHINKQELM